MSSPDKTKAWLFWASVALGCVGLVGIRIWAALGDYWLDEILSLEALRGISGPGAVFTGLHSDNNHYLNSLWLYYVAGSGGVMLGRLLSLVSGAGILIMAALIGARRSRACAAFSVFVMGASYIMILYASEARGYALAIFCALAAFYFQEACLREWKTARALGIAVFATLGLLAHLTFDCVLASLVVWMVFAGLRNRWRFGVWVGRLALCFGLPLCVAAVLCVVDVRSMEFCGGTISPSLIHAYGTALVWILGTTRAEALTMLALILAVVVLDVGLRRFWREDRAQAVFFAAAILVLPLSQAAIASVSDLYPRYFVVGGGFLLLLLARLLADLYEKKGYARLWALAAAAAFVAVNGVNTVELLRRGRGQDREALAYMAEHADAQPVRVASNHDFRVGTVVSYYAPALASGAKSVAYVEHDAWPADGVDWFVVQMESWNPPIPPARQISPVPGVVFTFAKAFPSAPLSGLHWYLYQRDR